MAGTWKDLTDNVNSMAANLTTQVRGIAKVVTDVANGNLKRKLVLETKGEIAELADTINGMIDTLGGIRRSGEQRRARGRQRRQAGRPGAGARRGRNLARSYRQRQPACREPDYSGPRHRGCRHGRDQGRLDAFHRRRGSGRSRCVKRQHQRNDRQPCRDNAQEYRSGLAQDKHRQVHGNAAGPARSGGGLEITLVRTDSAGRSAERKLLHHRFRP